MNTESFMTIFENIGGFVGIMITLITFWGIVSKRPIEAFKKMIREESKKADETFKEEVREVLNRANKCDETMVALLRHDITEVYELYKEKESMPNYIKEDVFRLIEQYEQWGGNSYIGSLKREMETWDTD